MASSADKKLTGLVAATFTPFTTEGEINLLEIGPYIDYLTEKQGVNNIFGSGVEPFNEEFLCVTSNPAEDDRRHRERGHIAKVCDIPNKIYHPPSEYLHPQLHNYLCKVNGTTGEGMSLTVAERKSLADEWCQKAKGKKIQVIVHVGCMSLKDSQDLARHAEQIGADAIAVIAPSFFKPKTADVLKMFLQEVASVAPTLPFYYYHIPAITGVNVLVRDLLEGIEELIPTFRGVKFSGSDLMDFGQCVSYCQPHWSLLYGVDEQLLAALAMGAHGAVGSTYNYIGCHISKLISAFEKGDLVHARTIQFKMQELLRYAMKLGFDLGVNKQLMIELSGLTLGPPRLPVMPCPREHALSIVNKYHNIFPDC